MDRECIFLYVAVQKSKERGSYDYIDQGRPGNPKTIYPKSFENRYTLYFPIGMTLRLRRDDERAIRELREAAMRKDVPRGIYQVRRNYGGVNAKNKIRKTKLALGFVDTSQSGTRILIRDFRV